MVRYLTDEEFHRYERTATVITSCDGERIPYNDDGPEFLNIEEDFEGRDVLTFKCPKCVEAHSSHVYG